MIVVCQGRTRVIRGDTVVVAAGVKAVNALYADLMDRGPEIYLIGDAKTLRKALEAVAEGLAVGRSI